MRCSSENRQNSIDWQFHMVKYIRSYENNKPGQHPIIYGVPWGDDTRIWESPSEAVSPGLDKVTGVVYRDNPPVNDGYKVIINDTDHLWGEGGDRKWVWKCFVRGLTPVFMDNLEDSDWREFCRKAMGDTRKYAEKMNLAAMTPLDGLSSTNCCLANLNSEYLVYQSDRGPFTLNLKGACGTFTVEWFNPCTHVIVSEGAVNGGTVTEFTPPFDGDAVLYLKMEEKTQYLKL